MFGGGGGLNPRKMQQMMEQMGIDLDELDAAEVVITLSDGDRLVFDDAEVTRMEARGQETYQVLGDPDRVGPAEAGGGAGGAGTESGADDGGDEADGAIPDDDVQLVVERTGASPDEAREALDAEDGDLAAAISRLE